MKLKFIIILIIVFPLFSCSSIPYIGKRIPSIPFGIPFIGKKSDKADSTSTEKQAAEADSAGMVEQVVETDTVDIVLSDNKYAVEMYNRGVEFLNNDSIDAAINALKRAIKIDKKFVEAHHQLGLAHLEKGTIYGRKRAVRALREALFWERKNFQIQLDLGKVYLRQGFRYNAKKKFNWLRETDPNNIELLLALAKLFQEDVEYYQNMVNTFTDDRGVLSFVDANLLTNIFNYDGAMVVKQFLRDRDELFGQFQDYSNYLEKDFSQAVMAYKQVLHLDPENREAIYQLGLLAFTAGVIPAFIKI